MYKRQALINVINTPEGQEIFSVYSHTGYAVATDADYDGARAALKVAQDVYKRQVPAYP